MFCFLRKRQIVFHHGYSILHSHKQCKRISISPHLSQHFLFSVFFFFNSHSSSSEVVSHFGFYLISLVNNNAEFLFLCLLCNLFAEMSIRVSCLFLNWVIWFFVTEL